nr:Chromatin assembly factor 1 subunit A like [Ipomoea batatas]
MRSPRWGYFRIITGTIAGGILGFYVMHRAELKYKEIWNERLKKYEEEMKMKQSKEAPSEFQETFSTRVGIFTHTFPILPFSLRLLYGLWDYCL